MATDAEIRLRAEMGKQFPDILADRLVGIRCEVPFPASASSARNSYLMLENRDGSRFRTSLSVEEEGKVIVAFADAGFRLPECIQVLDCALIGVGPVFVDVRFALMDAAEVGK